MKLIVKAIAAPAVPGGKAFALCDEHGEMLPLQFRTVVDNGVERATVTVEFLIDGDQARIE